MRDHHHPRNLRRSFGSQPVVCVSRPSWSEAGIAALVIPAQSSRWTSRGQGDVHCRLGDLATLVVDDSWGNRSRTLFRLQLRRFLHLQSQRRGFRFKPGLPALSAYPRPKYFLGCPRPTSSSTRLAPFPL